jgi:restriction system protein
VADLGTYAHSPYYKIIFYWLDGAAERFFIRKRFKKGEEWRSDRELLAWLKGMKPDEFELYVADMFSRLGYEAKKVGGSHDGGVDVVLRKNGVMHYVQCKKFIRSKVSVGEMRDFYGSLADRLSDGKGFFITTNIFTLEAEDFAKDKPIELIDGNKLVAYVRMAEKAESTKKEKDKTATASESVCPVCGGPLVRRKGKFGYFLGCTNYPTCTYTTNIH